MNSAARAAHAAWSFAGNAVGPGVVVDTSRHLDRVLSMTVLLAGVNVVLMTALCTLGAFMYNMAASLVGGLHVTFTEDV